MQTLWSRVAQKTCSCHCPQCLKTPARAIRRRANTGTASQVPRFFPSSTFVYSTLIAAAVTAEGARKYHRKEQWDAAIANAKKELETADETTLKDDLTPSFLSRSEEDRNPFSILGPTSTPRLWPETTGQPLATHHLPPQSVYSHQSRKRYTSGVTYSPKKMERIRLATDILQLQIWLEMRNRSPGLAYRAALAKVPKAYSDIFANHEKILQLLKHKRSQLRTLRHASQDLREYVPDHTDIPLSNYIHHDEITHESLVSELNASLQALVESSQAKYKIWKDGTRYLPKRKQGHLLARLAYNLHISSAPPNVDTCNALLLGLYYSRVSMFQNLLPSVLNWIQICKIRPNEITLEYALRSFILRNDSQGFSDFVNLIRGQGEGLMLARADMPSINDTACKRLSKKLRNERKIVQLPSPSPSVLAAMVQGVLHFSDLQSAKQLCAGMREQGWGIGMYTLRLLLRKAADEKKWDEGVQFWRQLRWQRRMSVMKHGLKHAECILSEGYSSMMRLCRDHGKGKILLNVIKCAGEENLVRSRLEKDMAEQDKQLLQNERLEGRKTLESGTSDVHGDVQSVEAPEELPPRPKQTLIIEEKDIPAEEPRDAITHDHLTWIKSLPRDEVNTEVHETEPSEDYFDILPPDVVRYRTLALSAGCRQ